MATNGTAPDTPDKTAAGHVTTYQPNGQAKGMFWRLGYKIGKLWRKYFDS